MNNVFVCAGMCLAKDERINKEAELLGDILAENKVWYVQGGCGDGLMGLTLAAFVKKSKKVAFIIPKAYFARDVKKLKKIVRFNIVQFRKVRSETERLKTIKKCNHIIVLPGGTGTLEELLYCNETFRAGEHKTQIDVININGFFNPLIKLIENGVKQGLINPESLHFNVLKSVKEIKF